MSTSGCDYSRFCKNILAFNVSEESFVALSNLGVISLQQAQFEALGNFTQLNLVAQIPGITNNAR